MQEQKLPRKQLRPQNEYKKQSRRLLLPVRPPSLLPKPQWRPKKWSLQNLRGQMKKELQLTKIKHLTFACWWTAHRACPAGSPEARTRSKKSSTQWRLRMLGSKFVWHSSGTVTSKTPRDSQSKNLPKTSSSSKILSAKLRQQVALTCPRMSKAA